MNKHTATHEGKTFTRNSKGRSYSHVALAKHTDGEWYQIGWSSSRELAEKQCRGGVYSAADQRGYMVSKSAVDTAIVEAEHI